MTIPLLRWNKRTPILISSIMDFSVLNHKNHLLHRVLTSFFFRLTIFLPCFVAGLELHISGRRLTNCNDGFGAAVGRGGIWR
ncbi:hypothetical protein IC582_022095 [Cucumis melo]